MKKLKVLVVYPGRFGFHVVSYFLCKYGSQKHEFSYLGTAFSATENFATSANIPNVTVHDHSCKSGIFGRLSLLKIIENEVASGNYDVVFTAYIPGISILQGFFLKSKVKVIVDIRSGFLVGNTFKRYCLNALLRFECRRFQNLTINSTLLSKHLGFSHAETTELPLGAEPVATTHRTFDKLHLLYVGALSKRNIELTVLGLKYFIDRCGRDCVSKYDIVGAGSEEDEKVVFEMIVSCGLENVVAMHGYIPREKTSEFLQNANLGVSYVPITQYYDMQPVTKTYEFLLAGLPLIATRTTQNQRFVNSQNGILVEDSPESFSQGLLDLKSQFDIGAFDSEKIQEASKQHAWENVISEFYLPFIEGVVD